MAGRLDGKVVLVSGGASGIGAAHVRVFAAEGAKVMVADVQEDKGGEVADSVNNDGGVAVFVRLDVTRADDWQNVVNAALSHFGKLTTLINNAGVYWPAGVEEETPEKWNQMVAINQTGVWLGMKTVVPALRDTGNGAIVNISSLYGLVGSPGSISYHATKGAVRIMTKAAALEYVRQGIRVNSIHPGQIDTPILAGLTPEQNTQIQEATPMGRLGRPEEIASLGTFLASEQASFITGSAYDVDGGMVKYMV